MQNHLSRLVLCEDKGALLHAVARLESPDEALIALRLLSLVQDEAFFKGQLNDWKFLVDEVSLHDLLHHLERSKTLPLVEGKSFELRVRWRDVEIMLELLDALRLFPSLLLLRLRFLGGLINRPRLFLNNFALQVEQAMLSEDSVFDR